MSSFIFSLLKMNSTSCCLLLYLWSLQCLGVQANGPAELKSCLVLVTKYAKIVFPSDLGSYPNNIQSEK